MHLPQMRRTVWSSQHCAVQGTIRSSQVFLFVSLSTLYFADADTQPLPSWPPNLKLEWHHGPRRIPKLKVDWLERYMAPKEVSAIYLNEWRCQDSAPLGTRWDEVYKYGRNLPSKGLIHSRSKTRSIKTQTSTFVKQNLWLQPISINPS